MVHHIQALWNMRISAFWPIWTTMTVGAVFLAWAVARAGAPSVRSASSPLNDGALAVRPSLPRSAKTGLALTAVVLFLAGFVLLSAFGENFGFYDDIQLTLFSLRGHALPPSIWPASGRFFPLGLQEFNLLAHFTRTIAGFHILLVVQLLIMAGALLTLDEELSFPQRAALLPLVLIAPGIVIAFTGVIYPERDVIFCLACLLLAVKRFDRTFSPIWAAAAAGCAQIMLYEKESVSLLLLAFCGARLILRQWSQRGSGRYAWLKSKESRLDLVLCSLAGLFLLYYFAAMYPHPNTKYADDTHLPFPVVLASYLRLDLLAWILVGVLLVRLRGIYQRRIQPSLLWDSLAFGGVIYFATYLRLGIFRPYYLAPVELISVLYVGRFALLSWDEMLPWKRAAAIGVTCLVAVQWVAHSAFHVLERQNSLQAKAEVVRLVERQYSQSEAPPKLFFPFASTWKVMEFGYYLEFRGIPVEDDQAAAENTRKPVELVLQSAAANGRCVKFWGLICRAAARPNPGDLVVVLPDDNVGSSQVGEYLGGGERVLSWDHRLRVPNRFFPIVRMLSIASADYSHEKLPDRWPDASVTLWR